MAHSFTSGASDGANPAFGNLVSGPDGNLFGTTGSGGEYDSGAVFELASNGSGGWTETILYSFKNNGRDGTLPKAGLVFDAAGNLNGTTYQGGTYCYGGCGTVFKLSPNQDGSWSETVLHSFGGDNDGFYPYGGLVLDALGNLYGTTYNGGIYESGTVFKLRPNQNGTWTEAVIHSFNDNGIDGEGPWAGLIIDALGNLYGTASEGGTHCAPFGCGTVFELSPNQNGGWSEKVLHSFGNGTDGSTPLSSLVFDSAGNLYGTTIQGGTQGAGTAFQLTPDGRGGWNERVLHSFGQGNDGVNPDAGLVFDVSGNLYGTTYQGGVKNAGTVFVLTPTEGGDYSETVMHNFSPADGDGSYPQSGLISGSSGNLYGTTLEGGGMYNAGTVFEVTP